MPNNRNKSPRSIPRTQQDVDRAYEHGYNKGFSDGIVGSLAIMLYTLKDKFGATDDQLQEFADAYNYTYDSINKDYISVSDLSSVLKREYGTTLDYKMETPDPRGGANRGS